MSLDPPCEFIKGYSESMGFYGRVDALPYPTFKWRHHNENLQNLHEVKLIICVWKNIIIISYYCYDYLFGIKNTNKLQT